MIWSWQDDALTDYYFGVSEDEATPERPAYTPGESQWVSYGFNSSWRLSDRITFFGNVGFGGADSSVLNSPLVEESSGSGYSLAVPIFSATCVRPKATYPTSEGPNGRGG